MLEADFVIIGSGSAGAALAYRLSEDGRNSVIVIEYRRQRFRSVHPDAGSAFLPDEHVALRLGFSHRARAASRRPRAGDAARQGDRRLVVDQRHGLCARPCPRLRPLGRAGRGRLVVRRRAALLQAHGERRGRRGRLARQRRADACAPGQRASTRSTRPSSRPAGRPASRRPEDYNGSKQEGFGAMEQTIHHGRRWSTANAYLQAGAEAAKRQSRQGLRAAHRHRESTRHRRRDRSSQTDSSR